jgi:hypothetical protein
MRKRIAALERELSSRPPAPAPKRRVLIDGQAHVVGGDKSNDDEAIPYIPPDPLPEVYMPTRIVPESQMFHTPSLGYRRGGY